MVKIRLARRGRTKRPIYTIVAADINSPRDGKFLERLGQYDPMSAEVLKQIKVEALSKWIKKGAILTDTVRSLLKKHKIQINL
ncbi:MAG: 30S ribosomal protein S16 [Oligoflexia bacterium]|nr:30S ribosomal protein S16 [Oligoflexia bacterium]